MTKWAIDDCFKKWVCGSGRRIARKKYNHGTHTPNNVFYHSWSDSLMIFPHDCITREIGESHSWSKISIHAKLYMTCKSPLCPSTVIKPRILFTYCTKLLGYMHYSLWEDVKYCWQIKVGIRILPTRSYVADHMVYRCHNYVLSCCSHITYVYSNSVNYHTCPRVFHNMFFSRTTQICFAVLQNITNMDTEQMAFCGFKCGGKQTDMKHWLVKISKYLLCTGIRKDRVSLSKHDECGVWARSIFSFPQYIFILPT